MAGESYRIRSRQKNGHHSGLSLVTILGDMKHRQIPLLLWAKHVATWLAELVVASQNGHDEDMRS